jgi:hypothetical protein
MTSSPSPPAAGWFAQLRRRVGILWWLKSVGTMAWIATFFYGYFWVLRNPIAEVTVMPLTPLDHWFPFRPEALALYVSLWVYVSLPPALVRTFHELLSIGIATAVMSVIGLAIFLLWPTSVPVFPVDTPQNAALSLLRGVDLSANACPSLHVAFAVYSGVWMARLLREVNSPRAARVVSWLWCLGIVYSTLATRQHVVLDVVAGAILGVAVAVAHLRGLRWYEERGTAAPARPSIGRVPGA